MSRRFLGAVDLGANKITTTAVPTAGPDLTNKTYVDAADAALGARVTALEGVYGGSYRASASQTIAGGLNKLTFGSTIQAAAGITWNGTDTFTVTQAGLYALSASNYMPGTGGFSSNVFIGSSAASLGSNYISGNFTSAGLSAEASIGAYPLAAGATICAYAYSNGASTGSLWSFDPAEFHVYKVG
jgi:hypothetical protein